MASNSSKDGDGFTGTARLIAGEDTWARTGAMMWLKFASACCAIQLIQISIPRSRD